MTDYSSRCRSCDRLVVWIDCPTGGWWSHFVHPDDDHDAYVDWEPPSRMNDHGEWETL